MGSHLDVRPSFGAAGNDVTRVEPALHAESRTGDGNGSQVVVSTRTLADALYVIAVNEGDSATDATISLPSLDGRTVTVLGESRRVELDGGSFTDHFVPLDVHIYVAASPGR